MSFQVRRDRNDDRSRFNSQQRWIPRNSSASQVAVNQPSLPPNTDRNSQGFDAGAASPPLYLQRHHHVSAPPPYNQHQRSCIIAPPPPNHQIRNNALGTLPHYRQKVASRTRPVNRGKRVAKEENIVLTDPNLPQLVQEIQEKLVKSSIECMICYDKVGRSANIWSCSSCYSIFHMNCIKRWARAPTSIDLLAEKNQGDNWRCPGCQSVQLTSSKEISYRCFCGKRKDPPPDPYLTPHSCGEPCGKPLEKEFAVAETNQEDLCPHICVLQCHPGPCPPCKAFAPHRSCPCGKKMFTTRCSERRSVLVCGQRCEKLLNCGRHQCERACHVGTCGPCQVLVNATCFCKKKVETVICGDMNVNGELKAEDGVYSCSSSCGKPLGCGNHFCSEVCHPGPCGDCDLLPSRVKTCYCGKTRVEEQVRQSCLDPIPSCSNVCRKLLPCRSHTCIEVCHAGDCPPCLVQVNQKCQCGSTSRAVECYITTSSDTEKFVCAKPCGRKKNCGRHRCSERCCPLLNAKKNDLSGDWDPHVCQIPCGKKLRCKQHACESLCHSGHCPPCLEMIFTDLTCACGRTSIPPPLPCGTPVPSCQLSCSIPQPCGHSATHECHFGDCPPCSAPVEKKCVGGHVVLRNIPCGLKDIRCNKICGKTRRCGLHACARTCHSEPCDSYNESEAGMRITCGQKCGAPRRDCRHTCAALCHPSAPCPDTRCEFPVTITCSCGRITATVPCDTGGRSANGSYIDSAYDEASVLRKLPAPLQPVESSGNQIPLGQRKLSCDDECAKLERKRVLQDAFDITPPNLEALHFSENSAMTEIISDLYRRDPKWVLAVEERCKFLVLGKARGSTSALKVHVFCPMLKDKRETVRLIAERWKLAVSNAGWEPKRFTVVHVTPKSKPPTRIIGARGGAVSIGGPHPPPFDPLVDMDPGLVVSLQDLPREANISALVLRFGGECELFWLNDKNALAVFHDHARAATGMRRLDHGSVYHGAMVVQNGVQSPSVSNAWGNLPSGSAWDVQKGNPWKKAVIQENDDSWGAEDSPMGGSSTDIQASASRSLKSNILIATSVNRWSVLEREKGSTSTLEPTAQTEESSSSKAISKQPVEGSSEEVVDDWEKVCD